MDTATTPAYRRRCARTPVWLVLWIVGTAVYIALYGPPLTRGSLIGVVVFGLLASTIGNDRVWARVVVDWLPLLGLLYVYDLLRGQADEWLTPHTYPQIEVDRFLFGGLLPTVELQRVLYTPGRAHVWDYFAFGTYLTHFFVPVLVAAALWLVSRERFRRYAFLYVTLTFAAFVTYLLFPAVPPWLASVSGAIEPTTRIVDAMWAHVGLSEGTQVFSATSSLANPVAAVPSLHAAYPLLLVLFFWRCASRTVRLVLACYPLAMAFALVYTAEHYVVDVALGWLYAVVVFLVGNAAFDAYRRRRMATPATVVTSCHPPSSRKCWNEGTLAGG